MLKRSLAILMSILALAASVGCGGKPAATADPFASVPLENLLEDIYANVDEEMPILDTQQITAENEQYFLGVTGLDIKEAIASEPMISAIAYSLCLVRMNEGADIEAAKKQIAENVDPLKWICVRVDAQNVRVESAGNVIMLIMSDEYADAIQKSFTDLAGK